MVTIKAVKYFVGHSAQKSVLNMYFRKQETEYYKCTLSEVKLKRNFYLVYNLNGQFACLLLLSASYI